MSLEYFAKKVLEKIGLFEEARIIVKRYRKRKRLTRKYKFEDRMKNKEKVCIVLSGYQEYVWDIVFKRIKKFIPDDIEVCILSSGKYSEKLSKIAEANDWSYLSTKRNNVSLIQNVAINLFKSAKYIYKLDEDIFVTENFFETLMNTLKNCEENGEYQVGFVTPTIPINGFGYVDVLKRFNLTKEYQKLKKKLKSNEKMIRITGENSLIYKNSTVARFIWEKLPNIDEMNNIVQHDKFEYEICPIRFSIGAILFKRELWYEMDYFDVISGWGMGNDEDKICIYCMARKSKAIIASKNTIVGHLSYGPQKKEMEEYYKEHKEVFDIH